MLRGKIGSVVVIIVGVVLLFCSFYIKGQVKEGQEKISGIEKNVGIGDKLFSLSPASKEIGSEISKPIREKVAEGKDQIEFYSSLAKWLEIAGVILVVVGVFVILIKKK